ncbi:MAG: Protein containing transglutaminase-like domain, putative cysteine protease [uncultured Chloroflexi bacterium]|uniref:Protein containing transglutaminase-like domain, putative cysteine protease n=1 Tax=uncultured Chloroflexota bacterium TaxID=166587 RepID=A0A6J4IA75_9CHLR|nr:MAG: Protein containing transglutaminase-like domain, putative cysteine protease [uncultured Chloroflexota bacterium]
MRINLRHTTRLEYASDVLEGVMDVRLGPLSDNHQRWERYDLLVDPAGAVRRYADGFGNTAHLLTVVRPHSYVQVVAGGVVETLLSDPFAQPTSPPRPLSAAERYDFLSPSKLVDAVPQFAELAEPFRPSREDDLLAAVRDMTEWVNHEYSYERGVTNVGTTAQELIDCRTGVCQDFTHVLLALCRAIDVPARYVSGYIVVTDDESTETIDDVAPGRTGRPRTILRGAGESHAWVEAFIPTHGWRGFDPTNNVLASEQHVKMAYGRDYADVPPTRGTYRGPAEEHLSVTVETRVVL